MQLKKLQKFNSVAMAMAAATLLGGCQGYGESKSDSSAASAKTDLSHCYGVNKCGGHNDCKGAGNACAGKASCKGQGFVAMPAKACGDIGGTVKDDWRGSVAKADLTHCYGVNKCGGHNDCKGAGNACAGKASCKGQGFVAMPAKACGDVGGKNG
ncbi:MAG: hypothetical protein U9R74_03340 [Pseudomonadota bacterium]|nr:hypothetical protein [Pseudomonadota bacterium]